MCCRNVVKGKRGRRHGILANPTCKPFALEVAKSQKARETLHQTK